MKAWNRNGDGFKAAHVLEQWRLLLEGDLELAPTREAFHLLLQAFARRGGAQDETLAIVEYLERMKSMGNLNMTPPDTETFAYVLGALARSQVLEGRDSHWTQIQAMLDRLYSVYRPGEAKDVYFRMHAYSHVICFAISIDRDDEAMELLEQMNSFLSELSRATSYQESQAPLEETPAQLVGIAYQSVLSKLLRHPKYDVTSRIKTAQQMDSLLAQLEKTEGVGLPWPQHYEMTIDAWSKTVLEKVKKGETQLQPGSHCEDLLRRMEERHLRHSFKKCSLKAYERVLWTHFLCRHPAERLLAHMMALLDDYPNAMARSESHLTAAWNHVLKAYFDNDEQDRTLRLWHRMQSLSVTPDIVTYDTVLKALSRSTQPNAAAQAYEILNKLIENNENGASTVAPTATHYASVIIAWSRSPEEEAAAKAQLLLEQLEDAYLMGMQLELKPTTSIYNAVITAWARSSHPEAAIKAEQLLLRMTERSITVKDPPKPDVISYNCVIDALSRQRSVKSAKKADALLLELESDDNHIQPQQVSFTSAMNAWVRSGAKDAPERVMAIYGRLLSAYEISDRCDNLRPDKVTYGILLSMWAKSKREDAGVCAEKILRDMQESGIQANAIDYNNVITAHARSKKHDAFENAEVLLKEMEERYMGGDESVKPNTFTYTTVIQALKRSRPGDKAQTAWDMLKSMSKAYSEGNVDVRPNVITMNSVITACAFAKGDEIVRERAVRLALATMSEMDKEQITPDSTTFCMLLQVIGRQVSDLSENTKFANVVFQRCCRDGMVNNDVMEALRRFAPSLYEQLPKDAISEPKGRYVQRT